MGIRFFRLACWPVEEQGGSGRMQSAVATIA